MSVSQYYSNELVMFMRAVLQIIPTSMFALLAKIIRLQTNYPSLRELPTKVEKEKLTEYALETQRFEVARLTHDASVLAQVRKISFTNFHLALFLVQIFELKQNIAILKARRRAKKFLKECPKLDDRSTSFDTDERRVNLAYLNQLIIYLSAII